MIGDALLMKFLNQFENLKSIVSESSARSIKDPPDSLFYDHQNVFIKSYLVSACSMLEAFIQDLAYSYIDNLQTKINTANLPFNLVAWIVEHEKANLQFKALEANKSRKDISALISPNYGKTVQAFRRIGINLSESEISTYKDFISTTVDKRNKIIHNNDDALDMSFSDVVAAIDIFEEYAKCLFKVVCSNPHLKV
jgi:hypothetical protein